MRMTAWQKSFGFTFLERLSGVRKVGIAVMAAAFLAGCQADELGYGPKAQRPVSADVKRKMSELNMSSTSPIMVRIFKQENELEVWKQARNGRYQLLEKFEICKWSGELGPKFKEGDRQAPEGFYEITPGLMNPNSNYHLAFNLGYPNQFDRAHGRTGTHLMVHGACSSRGCYAMTDAQVQDIYALARDSFKGGQRSFQVQAFPFHMTPENMAKYHDSEHMDFWRMLKVGYDHFELTKVPPKVDVCEKKYVFDATPLVEGVPFRATAKCPEYKVPDRVALLIDHKQREDEKKFETIVAKLEAREERQKRWDERQKAIAGVLGGGQAASVDVAGSAPASEQTEPVAAEVAAATAAPKERPEGEVATAYAPSDQSGGTPGNFLKRWLPFGEKTTDDTTTVGPIETSAAPVPKP